MARKTRPIDHKKGETSASEMWVKTAALVRHRWGESLPIHRTGIEGSGGHGPSQAVCIIVIGLTDLPGAPEVDFHNLGAPELFTLVEATGTVFSIQRGK